MLEGEFRDKAALCECCEEEAARKAAACSPPKVSVIIGTFNCEPFIEECVRSVMNQTEKQLEIIVVDDGSTDGTLSILKALQLEDDRIRVHTQRHTGYPGAGRNHGISVANGRYIAFLDGDDFYHPLKIERVLLGFETCPEADVVFHDLLFIDGRMGSEPLRRHLTARQFLKVAKDHLEEVGDGVYLCHKSLYNFTSICFYPFHTNSIVMRKEVLLSQPYWFREDLRIGEDGDLWLRLAKDRPFAFVNEPLSYYRLRADSVTGDQELYCLRRIQVDEENLERGMDIFNNREIRLYQEKIAGLFSDLGYVYFCKLRLREARAAYRKSLGLDFQPGVLVAYMKTFAPRSLAERYSRTRSESN